ncbi:UbiA family prenyltransferase [Candidatus Obscuribacterales bacterium]|nr:UbiA family prenyltransferase [Candidatus Obscuribacterales bacterium]MBX3149538.1 UbiA family prenyltransferase [Candidatus Obscuribacterales bacterium]
MDGKLSKWITYQKERFPLVRYSLLVSAFSASGLSLSFLLTGMRTPLTLPMFIVAFTVTLMLFFQLRVADEHKDYEYDSEHHPERPVPRGLVSLSELRILGIGAGVLQLLAVSSLSAKLLLPLLLAWIYMLLMTKEFFIGEWLRRHPIIYMVTHMCILFFTDLFITSCHFMVSNIEPPLTLLYFLATSFSLGTVIELGRKIRSPLDETTGTDTYSSLWGKKTAVRAWLAAMTVSGVLAIATAFQIHSGPLAVLVLSFSLFSCWLAGRRFLSVSTPAAAKRLDTLSGAWTLTTYLMIGLIPLLVTQFS